MIILSVILILFAFILGYLFCIGGRTGHPGLKALKGWNYAHRGLHDGSLPENSMGAFRAALESGCGIELDVHLMKDGNLAVIHDSSLQRTAGVDVRIEDLTLAQLRDMLNTSRKYAQALVEYFDKVHITKKDGDIHYLDQGF